MNNETIMLIDDDQDLRESITEILEDNGFAVIGCNSAETALKKLKTARPSLIILDNMMPGMGGMALLPLIKNDLPAAKIIMITAFSTVDNAVAAMKGGADDYLAKPFRREELLMAVKRGLEELKFEELVNRPDLDATLASLANPIRRQILTTLSGRGRMRFMDITRDLGVSDHTKINFHLKNLKENKLVLQDREKLYSLTSLGEKIVDCLCHLSAKLGQ